MYRQINVHPEDWDLQRILWLNSSGEIEKYQLTTVTYGLACAPFLAMRVMLQLIQDEGHKFPWKEFVHNRVCLIQETLPTAQWRLIPGKMNPADCATRGLTPEQLSTHELWWSGPDWLKQSEPHWPSVNPTTPPSTQLEERPPTVFTTIMKSPPLWELVYKYSSLTKLLRITAICRRTVLIFKKLAKSITIEPISPEEIDWAKQFWCLQVQISEFPNEHKLLQENQPLSKSSSLYRFTPFIDSVGLIRIGGRLHNSPLNYPVKHPIEDELQSGHLFLNASNAHDIVENVQNNLWVDYHPQEQHHLDPFYIPESTMLAHFYSNPGRDEGLKELGKLASLLANDGTKWIFNPPASPHFGGKWEAGVKSVKYHLKRIVGDTILTYEEMTTVLNQIEAILNSRPLCPLSDDPDDLTALTPGHFLIGEPLITIPEPSLALIKISRMSIWQLTSHIVAKFWNQWSKSCLQRYLANYK
ncbi:uncharacterized protein [Venturia canescens]|uniref:uncharacterized protein n=1 Tax=Venturia canescens TaxID=32260 RepID=UPI001C9D0675|nr:uncharacterized protein LOC122412395 [Venturia canescens]